MNAIEERTPERMHLYPHLYGRLYALQMWVFGTSYLPLEVVNDLLNPLRMYRYERNSQKL